jgi:glycosyltransferase involved in cell wall biosynthesis
MKILISIGTLGLGGAEKQAVWLANSLSEIHEVTLLTYHGGVREKDLGPKVIWKTIYEIQDEEINEIQDEEINEDFNSIEKASRERDSVTSISKFTLLEEKVKTSFKNFPLTLKILRYSYIKSMPFIQIVRSSLRLAFELLQRSRDLCNTFVRFIKKFRSGLTWKNFSKRIIRFGVNITIAFITRFLHLLRKPILYLTLSSLRQKIKNQTYVFIRARRIVKEVRPDLIITFLFHDTLNVGLAGLTQINRPKLIVGRRSPIGYGDSYRNYFHRIVLKIIYRFADLAVSNSSGNLESAINDGLIEDKVKLVHNFVQDDSSKMRLNESKNIHLVCVSNFFDYKNHRNLIKALGEINNQFKFRVSFLGDGPLRGEMIYLAKSLNLKADFFSHEDQIMISEFKVDFLLLPSYFEGSSNALLESLSQGIPAIVTNVGLVPELVAMGAPLIVSSGTDFKSLKNSLVEGLSLQHDLNVQASNFRSTIVNEFGEDKILQDWLQIIKKV